MTKPFYSQAEPPSEADIETTLRNAPDRSLVTMIGECAAGLKARWLYTAEEIGVFDFSAEAQAFGKVDRSAQCIMALLEFLATQAKGFGLTQDPLMRKFTSPMPSIVGLAPDPYAITCVGVNISPSFGEFITRLTDRLIADSALVPNAFPDHKNEWHQDFHRLKNASQAMTEAFAGLMAAACALDLPELIQKIHAHKPMAYSTPLKGDLLGPEFRRQFRLKPEDELPSFMPGFSAVFTSNNRSLASIGKAIGMDTIIPMLRGQKSHGWEKAVVMDAIGMLDRWFPACKPTTLALALSQRIAAGGDANPPDLANLSKLGIEGMEATGSFKPSLEHYVPALQSVGVFNDNPGRAFIAAAKHGHTEVLRGFEGRVPWTSQWGEECLTVVPARLIHESVKNALDNRDKARHEESMLALIDVCTQDGQHNHVFDTFTVPAEHKSGAVETPMSHLTTLVQPLHGIIVGGFNRVLVKYMENGLDPHAPLGHDSPSPIELAKMVGAETTENVMRSFTARRLAHALMDEIVVDCKKPVI